MTQRSIFSGSAPTVVINAGASVVVRGVDGDQVTAAANNLLGLRIRSKNEGIKVEIGGNGEVWVPFNSRVTVAAGWDSEVHDIQGEVGATSGRDLVLRNVERLAQAAAGGSMDLECGSVVGNEKKFQAGGNLRCQIRDLTSAIFRIKDLGGYWEATIGSGEAQIVLQAGRDVTLVTDQDVKGSGPDFILGSIERPEPAVISAGASFSS